VVVCFIVLHVTAANDLASRIEISKVDRSWQRGFAVAPSGGLRDVRDAAELELPAPDDAVCNLSVVISHCAEPRLLCSFIGNVARAVRQSASVSDVVTVP
jgi:hypothetical protein